MKYSQLTEGVIKVPPSLMSTLNKYVASTICTMLYKNIENVQKVSAKLPEKAEAQLNRIKQVISYLKQNYQAVILNDSTYKSIIQSSIKVPVNFGQFFSELNIPVSDTAKNEIVRSTLSLMVRQYLPDGDGGSLSADGALTTFLMQIKCDLNVAPLDENIFERSKETMDSIYHEAQHYVQKNVLQRINPHQKQLQSAGVVSQSTSTNAYNDYLSSGIEYSPWMGDLSNSIITKMEIMKGNDTLPMDGLNKFFMKVVTDITSDDKKSFGKFLYQVYKKDPQQYKDTMKKIFKMVQPAYDSIKNADTMEVLGDLQQEDIPVNFDVMSTLFSDLRPAVQKNGGQFKAYGTSIRDIEEIKLIYPEYEVSIKPSGDSFMFSMSSTDGKVHTYSRVLNQSDTLQLATVLSKYGDDAEMSYSAIMQTKADGKFSTEAIQQVFEKTSALCEKRFGEKAPYTSTEIAFGGITYEVQVQENSYKLTSPELMFLDAYLKNSLSLQLFFQDIIYAIDNTSAQEVQTELENCFNEYDSLKTLRSMY